MKQTVLTIIWAGAVLIALRSGPWSEIPQETHDISTTPDHASMYHMHQPLHSGGKVGMDGQFHLELLSRKDGTHRLWISNAFRQEIDPAGFAGTVTIKSEGQPDIKASFQQVGRTRELVAATDPIEGQAWLTIKGSLGQLKQFKGTQFFWDYSPNRSTLSVPLGLDSMVPQPASNETSIEKAALGRDLFFETQLSANNSLSCASCHRPEHAFAEPRRVAQGIHAQPGDRNTPSVLNSAYYPVLFWDGRRNSLEAQAIEPLLSPTEMGMTDEATIVSRLTSSYGNRFRDVMDSPISLESVAQALACYQRTLFSGNSAFDRFESGQRDAINTAAQRGRSLFFGKAGCGSCHVPPLFTDFDYHNLGVGWEGADAGDRGRFGVTNDPKDLGSFRTPSLRDVSRTAPYMHDGNIPTLRSVVEFYSAGGNANKHLDPQIQPLRLKTNEIDDLVAFLKSLDGDSPSGDTGGNGTGDRTGNAWAATGEAQR